ncbi:hypothetical protein SKAU_G00054200 [Synaphobranchus kaupii]|uniref:Uncharacterized protein n=1 Tax=Synaphobranchus kaupii TaxID=118154 RepID=A0A9Q1G517_SYNKA|nr:hypothetical protein SKAU_G00054200 [Synaphobranchus kaupii]
MGGCVKIRDLLSPMHGSAAEKICIKVFVSWRPLEDHQRVKQTSLTEDTTFKQPSCAARTCLRRTVSGTLIPTAPL